MYKHNINYIIMCLNGVIVQSLKIYKANHKRLQVIVNAEYYRFQFICTVMYSIVIISVWLPHLIDFEINSHLPDDFMGRLSC